jgi:hypothetical protein
MKSVVMVRSGVPHTHTPSLLAIVHAQCGVCVDRAVVVARSG